jgi:hypothetical protein
MPHSHDQEHANGHDKQGLNRLAVAAMTAPVRSPSETDHVLSVPGSGAARSRGSDGIACLSSASHSS